MPEPSQILKLDQDGLGRVEKQTVKFARLNKSLADDNDDEKKLSAKSDRKSSCVKSDAYDSDGDDGEDFEDDGEDDDSVEKNQSASGKSTSKRKKPSSESGLDNLAEAAKKAKIEERKARKRKMDAIYARNRRQREKMEENELKDQCLELSKKNANLQREINRLEALLADAQSKVALVEYGKSLVINKQKKAKSKSNKHSKSKSKRSTPNKSSQDSAVCVANVSDVSSSKRFAWDSDSKKSSISSLSNTESDNSNENAAQQTGQQTIQQKPQQPAPGIPKAINPADLIVRLLAEQGASNKGQVNPQQNGGPQVNQQAQQNQTSTTTQSLSRPELIKALQSITTSGSGNANTASSQQGTTGTKADSQPNQFSEAAVLAQGLEQPHVLQGLLQILGEIPKAQQQTQLQNHPQAPKQQPIQQAINMQPTPMQSGAQICQATNPAQLLFFVPTGNQQNNSNNMQTVTNAGTAPANVLLQALLSNMKPTGSNVTQTVPPTINQAQEKVPVGLPQQFPWVIQQNQVSQQIPMNQQQQIHNCQQQQQMPQHRGIDHPQHVPQQQQQQQMQPPQVNHPNQIPALLQSLIASGGNQMAQVQAQAQAQALLQGATSANAGPSNQQALEQALLTLLRSNQVSGANKPPPSS